MDQTALCQFSKDELVALLLAREERHQTEWAAMRTRIAESERRLGLNSSDSGKPPSSGRLRKPLRVRRLREGSGRKSGGRKGHPGETLRRSEAPDAVIDHHPPNCAACGAPLTEAMATAYWPLTSPGSAVAPAGRRTGKRVQPGLQMQIRSLVGDGEGNRTRVHRKHRWPGGGGACAPWRCAGKAGDD
ncbi:MAG: DUF6444 domain-containing protein, partial [Acetobacteraceae bacterium]